jgi:hypothetical protein
MVDPVKPRYSQVTGEEQLSHLWGQHAETLAECGTERAKCVHNADRGEASQPGATYHPEDLIGSASAMAAIVLPLSLPEADESSAPLEVVP